MSTTGKPPPRLDLLYDHPNAIAANLNFSQCWSRVALNMGRNEDAARLGISDVLINIAQNGRDYEPWVTEYDDRLSKLYETIINFKVNDKLYTLRLTNQQVPVPLNEAEFGLLVLERLGKTFYEARVYESTRLTGGWWAYGKPWEVVTYLPGKWVEEFQEVIRNVEKQRKT